MNRESLFESVVRGPVVVGVGLISLDVVVNGDPGAKARRWAGGTCGNVLTILSYLGWKAFPVSRLNHDSASKHVRADLTRWGVRLDFAQLRPNCQTPIVVQRIRQSPSGFVSHYFSRTCPNCGAWLPGYKPVAQSSAREVAARSEDPKVFFFDTVSRGALILAKEYSQRGAIVVFEPSSAGDPGLFKESLATAHIVKYSYERMRHLSEAAGKSEALLEIETLGRDGLRYRSKMASLAAKGWQRLEAYEPPAVRDDAGCGDWCTAGLIHSLGRNGLTGLRKLTPSKLHEGLSFCQALAAWNCGFEGPRGGMYVVGKKEFQTQIENIISCNRMKASVRDEPTENLKGMFRELCTSCGNGPKLSRTRDGKRRPCLVLRNTA